MKTNVISLLKLTHGYFVLDDVYPETLAPCHLAETTSILPNASLKRVKVGCLKNGEFVETRENVVAWVSDSFALGYCMPAMMPKVDAPLPYPKAVNILGYGPRLVIDTAGKYWVSRYDHGLKVPALIEIEEGVLYEFKEARNIIGPCSLNEIDDKLCWVSDSEPSVYVSAKLPEPPEFIVGA